MFAEDGHRGVGRARTGGKTSCLLPIAGTASLTGSWTMLFCRLYLTPTLEGYDEIIEDVSESLVLMTCLLKTRRFIDLYIYL